MPLPMCKVCRGRVYTLILWGAYRSSNVCNQITQMLWNKSLYLGWGGGIGKFIRTGLGQKVFFLHDQSDGQHGFMFENVHKTNFHSC